MPWSEFVTCWQRIHRAETHNRALTEIWNGLVADEAYGVVVQVDDDGAGTIRIEPEYDVLPPNLALELGEMLYQLRAALDACVYGAAIRETGKDPPPDEEHLEFPICGSDTEFNKARWHIKPLTGERRRIIEAVQPYNAPPNIPLNHLVINCNRTLGILNDWARKDRHRKLHIMTAWVASASPALRLPHGVRLAEMITRRSGFFLKHEYQIASFRLDGWLPGMKIQANAYATADVAVDEGPPPCADSDTLANRLKAMRQCVRAVVKAIEDSFTSQPRVGSNPHIIP